MECQELGNVFIIIVKVIFLNRLVTYESMSAMFIGVIRGIVVANAPAALISIGVLARRSNAEVP